MIAKRQVSALRNIPVFTTEFGVASLILESVAARKEAYVRIQSSLEPIKLIEECVAFCKACGAEKVYATGHEALESYPLHTSVLQMNADRSAVGETDAMLFPLQEQTAARWRGIYNEAMMTVDNAAWMSERAMKELIADGSGYFVHRDGKLLGIGKASGDRIDAVVSSVRGMGAEVVRALAHALSSDTVTIEVAATNRRAVSLYERLGFVKTKELSRWYKIF